MSVSRFIVTAVTAASLGFGLVQNASAADLPAKAPIYKDPVVAPAFSWTGWYIGGHVGAGWGTGKNSNYTLGGIPFVAGNDQGNIRGFLGGIQAGYNYQLNPWLVLGIEGDFSWTDIKGTSSCLNAAATCGGDVKWIGDVAGRLGLVEDRAFFYIKGGVAWVNADYSFSLPAPPVSLSANDTRTGTLLGLGVEYAMNRHWSAKLEYDYIELGTKNMSFNILGFNAAADNRVDLNLLKIGVNYRF